MRVTSAMLLKQAMYDLDGLREKYAKAQAGVNGQVLGRPSEDPQRVVEAMDLYGAKERLERSQRAGEDARQWLSVSENSLTSMIERIQAARELAVQAGGPQGLGPEGREGLAREFESIRNALAREMNGRNRDQYLFSGWKTDVAPFADDAAGGVTYSGGVGQMIVRDVAPGLSMPINIPGNQLLATGDFMKTISQMAADTRAGNIASVTGTGISQLDKTLTNLAALRSDLGTRQQELEHYEMLTEANLVHLQERLTRLTGADLETAVMKMTEAQNAYQAALASFAKALPASLLDYLR